MRRIAVVGDRLSNGGEVCSYQGPEFLIHGHQAALIGGAAYCPACKTTGYIVKDGGPRRMDFFVSEIAAHDDVVVCGCPEHPRIVAQLAGEAWYDDMAESPRVVQARVTMSDGASPRTKPDAAAIGTVQCDEQVHATATSANPDGYPYYIEMADGRVLSGRIESGGALPRMMTGQSTSEYIVYWGDDALEKSNEN
ncbi:PAAR domain-containing protein [Caballeronia grimmiae]|uniref:PAAR domain-containing protein n=1 Tax=Caballeronia grimmiae TaxID=1071679 RepID=UPI0038BBF12B